MNQRHIISSQSSLLDALARLNELPGNAMTLFVVDTGGHVQGTLTDGDIRRAFLAGATPHSAAGEYAHREFRYCRSGAIDVGGLSGYRRAGITLIPVLDAEGRICDILDLSSRRTLLPLRALLMAGGRGERLRPATLTIPKPLLPIEGKAIIDYNVEALAACGIDDITVAVRYLAEQIEEHFAGPVAGVQVKCIHESEALGTIGAAAYMPADSRPTLVMNSDLLTTISFEEMYLHHLDTAADISIAAVPYQVSVPYAVLTLDNEDSTRVAAIEEKPSYSYYANAGIYIINRDALALLKPGEHCDATDLIARAIAAGMKVSYYPINGTWIDVGSPIDFRQAGELMRHFNSMNK